MAFSNIGFRLKIFIALLIAVIITGCFGFMYTENLSFPDAVYFTVVTVTTVGYGDIHPVTSAGKLLAIILIITGVGTFLGVVANATELLLSQREKEVRMEKLNIIIGVFFSEAGTKLLTYFIDYDPDIETISRNLAIKTDWTEKEFLAADKHIREHAHDIDKDRVDFNALRDFLQERSTLFLRLMENQNLLEHESFTDLLRAILHFKEELLCREDLDNLPDTDYTHMAGDIKRAYSMLVPQWLDYMRYLKKNYPYLFSLAVRMNPFNAQRSPVVMS
jgi:voltage-gated potassium channel